MSFSIQQLSVISVDVFPYEVRQVVCDLLDNEWDVGDMPWSLIGINEVRHLLKNDIDAIEAEGDPNNKTYLFQAKGVLSTLEKLPDSVFIGLSYC